MKERGMEDEMFESLVDLDGECNGRVIRDWLDKGVGGEKEMIEVERRKCGLGDFEEMGKRGDERSDGERRVGR